jgi:hypothetical protein
MRASRVAYGVKPLELIRDLKLRQKVGRADSIKPAASAYLKRAAARLNYS